MATRHARDPGSAAWRRKLPQSGVPSGSPSGERIESEVGDLWRGMMRRHLLSKDVASAEFNGHVLSVWCLMHRTRAHWCA